ncbi:putative cysteine desulfurase IscS 1 [Oceanobacillus oncorhynchi subsp. incaldanensis]|uniref:cysteine desulfurase n=1 Tax=Oceanobacillus oncorhynchi TaxID=545501 RepID=A0A0A1MES3_9BACI|nr:cysteine desulfurase family protein [Oceanobacillus oncorhynchi]GIO17096.1 putative cysteine desulfurase IscS 1 [Oceanobacillus oncorhynchi subsp. incaldanensis]CEI83855.1 Cysteine desulfurase [Oceanobacillus oncorhynchi]
MEAIYLDHAATSPMARGVAEAMIPVYEEIIGNASSVHSFGRKARQQLDASRQALAASIGANEKELIFTSGGTEADNMALTGVAEANRNKGNHIITSIQEHHAALHTAEKLEKQGFRVTYLPVDEKGLVSTQDVEAALTDDTILVSIMYVNNETGVIQPISEIGELLKEHQAYFHTDAVQAYGLLDIDVHAQNIDLLTATAHKIGGPKGIGFLYANEKVAMSPIQFGGEQERKRRPGTENIPAAVGFELASNIVMETKAARNQQYEKYKQILIDTFTESGIDFGINGDPEKTVSTIINVRFPGANVEALLANFDLSGVAASSGSACTAGSVEPSHVLSAMFGSESPVTTNSIRFSFGLANTEENVKEAAERIAGIVKRLTS